MKSTTCRECGAPRDPNYDRRLCVSCRRAYHREYYHKQKHAAQQRAARKASMAGYRLRVTYRRLGLRVGHVWEQVQP